MQTQPTCADKLFLLHLSHVVPPQVRRGHALRVKTQTGALAQPLRQPGHVAVTLQVVGVQATGEGEGGGMRSVRRSQEEGDRQVARKDGGWEEGGGRRNNRFEDGGDRSRVGGDREMLDRSINCTNRHG